MIQATAMQLVRGKGKAWRKDLLLTPTGQIRPTLENISLFLENSPEWACGVALNLLDDTIRVMKPLPDPISLPVGSEITDQFDTEGTRWVERCTIYAKPETFRRAIDAFARKNAFHPIRDYLNSLKWDGMPRVDAWLTTYAGVANSGYARAVGARWLISAVARVFEPGCKADCCLILESPQGFGKSTLLRTLAGASWFSDQIADLGSKDAALALRGGWIFEFSEMDSVSRAEATRTKAFLSQTDDRFRPPYGSRVVRVPRQCVFAGTTNQQSYLKDETGNRRFWPVTCARIDIAALQRDRDQIWAEVVHRYRAGEPWHLQGAEVSAAEVQTNQRRERDPWQSLIEEWVTQPQQRFYRDGHALLPVEPFTSRPGDVTTADVLLHALERPRDRWTKSDEMRVAACLRHAGMERYSAREGNKTKWRYRNASPPVSTVSQPLSLLPNP